MIENLANPEVENASLIKPKKEFFLTAERFNEWGNRGFFLYSVGDEDAEDNISKFDQIVPGNVYFLKKLGDNFSGFAEAEAIVQTHDAMKCIQGGEIAEPAFIPFKNIKPEFEYEIDVPKDKLTKGVNGPIKPDAVAFNGTKALILESKHKVTLRHALLFQKKCDILQQNSNAQWFLKEHPVRNYEIVPVMCSIAPFPNELLENSLLRNMKFLLRIGSKYAKYAKL